MRCRHVGTRDIVATYGVIVEPPSDEPWGMRDLAIGHPTGVLRRIVRRIDPPPPE